VSSSDVRVARLTALAALGIALLYFVSVPIGSLASTPASNASALTVAQFFAQHRDGLLLALALNGIAWCALMPVAFVGLRAVLGERGGIAATVALVCAGVEAALIGVALLFGAIAAYAAPHLSLELSKVFSDGMSIATSASAWPTIPCVIRERMPLLELDAAAQYMRRSDRVAVTLARRMPRAMRLAGQLAARGTSQA
jgi:hypothetical protein